MSYLKIMWCFDICSCLVSTPFSTAIFVSLHDHILCSFYFSEGFVHLESIVGEAIIRLMANPDMTECEGVLEHNISVSMRQLPYPQYTVDFFLITAVSILPFLIVLVFMYSAGTFTKVCCLNVLCTYMCIHATICILYIQKYKSPPGAGVGEGDTYQRVNVDDGSTAVGTVDHLVHQTVCFSLHIYILCCNPT